jgi:uracil-DNA glycosylase
VKILFCGQAPSRETDGRPPFSGKCGKFLAELLGTTQEEMLTQHEFINVLDRWPGAAWNGKGDRFPLSEAKVAAKAKLESMRGRTVVLLGNSVARAFGAKGYRYLEWYEIRNPDNFGDVVVPLMVVVPHPSGICRYYNDPNKRIIVGKFLRELAGKDLEPTAK